MKYVKYDNSQGDQCWSKDGLLHREDGPAVIKADGSKFWYKRGMRHRLDGPAEEFSDGSRNWYVDGIMHREDGPATESPSGFCEWYRNGVRHREDGPAIVWPYDGQFEYWFRGRKLYDVSSQEEFERLLPLLQIEEVQES
jgi:hypothetical protein